MLYVNAFKLLTNHPCKIHCNVRQCCDDWKSSTQSGTGHPHPHHPHRSLLSTVNLNAIVRSDDCGTNPLTGEMNEPLFNLWNKKSANKHNQNNNNNNDSDNENNNLNAKSSNKRKQYIKSLAFQASSIPEKNKRKKEYEKELNKLKSNQYGCESLNHCHFVW